MSIPGPASHGGVSSVDQVRGQEQEQGRAFILAASTSCRKWSRKLNSKSARRS